VLRTGCQWKALPREFGSIKVMHAHFQNCQKAGFFQKIRRRSGRKRQDGRSRIMLAKLGGSDGRTPIRVTKASQQENPHGHAMIGLRSNSAKKLGQAIQARLQSQTLDRGKSAFLFNCFRKLLVSFENTVSL
jgi:hypothetical protein